MLTKQERRQYGEQLRYQMKVKQQQKRQEDLSKRQKVPHIMDRNVYETKEKENSQPVTHPKQALQQQFEQHRYDPFGKNGGGAPIKNHQSRTIDTRPNAYDSNPCTVTVPTQPMQSPVNEAKISFDEAMRQANTLQLDNLPMSPNNADNTHQTMSTQPYQPQYQQQPQQYQQQYQVPSSQAPYQQVSSSPMSYQPHLNYQQPSMYNNYMGGHHPQYMTAEEALKHQLHLKDKNRLYEEPIFEINQQHEINMIQSHQNEQKMKAYKKGARNLLQLENQEPQKMVLKQKKQQEVKKYLKEQIEQAQKLKMLEKERLKREEEEDEKRRQNDLKIQKQRLIDEDNKKKAEKEKLEEANRLNLELKRMADQEAQQKALREKRDREQKENEKLKPQSSRVHHHHQKQPDSESCSSVYIENGFDTAISKNFFKNERQKNGHKNVKAQYDDHKLDAFNHQMQQMRDEISAQNELFQDEISKVKMEAERAFKEKKRAEGEVNRLKKELRDKVHEENHQLYEALNRYPKEVPQVVNKHETIVVDHSDKFEVATNSYGQQHVAKRMPDPHFELNRYKVEPTYLESNQDLEGSQMMSLDGDSKKIPVNLNHKLSMSRLDDYARETKYFRGGFQQGPVKPRKPTYQIKDSIMEVEQGKNYHQRVPESKRDQLDRLVDDEPVTKQWGSNFATDADDVTRQIEQLLRLKDQPVYDGRPVSKMSQAGQRALENSAISYDMATMKSINSAGYNTMFQVEKIHNRNDARLQQLKHLGVESINTNNDEDLHQLDQLLQKYQ